MSGNPEKPPEEKKPPEKPKPEIQEIKKECPECKDSKIFKGDEAKLESSKWLSEHLEKNHPEEDPEPDQQYTKKEKKKAFSLICDECGHQVASDTSERTEELLVTHQISHEQESKDSKKEKSKFTGDVALFAFGLALFLVSIGIIVGGVLLYRQKRLDDKTKDDHK